MNPKKVFLTFGVVFTLFILVCCISLAKAKSTQAESKSDQNQKSTTHYDLPKVVPVAWFTGV